MADTSHEASEPGVPSRPGDLDVDRNNSFASNGMDVLSQSEDETVHHEHRKYRLHENYTAAKKKREEVDVRGNPVVRQDAADGSPEQQTPEAQAEKWIDQRVQDRAGADCKSDFPEFDQESQLSDGTTILSLSPNKALSPAERLERLPGDDEFLEMDCTPADSDSKSVTFSEFSGEHHPVPLSPRGKSVLTRTISQVSSLSASTSHEFDLPSVSGLYSQPNFDIQTSGGFSGAVTSNSNPNTSVLPNDPSQSNQFPFSHPVMELTKEELEFLIREEPSLSESTHRQQENEQQEQEDADHGRQRERTGLGVMNYNEHFGNDWEEALYAPPSRSRSGASRRTRTRSSSLPPQSSLKSIPEGGSQGNSRRVSPQLMISQAELGIADLDGNFSAPEDATSGSSSSSSGVDQELARLAGVAESLVSQKMAGVFKSSSDGDGRDASDEHSDPIQPAITGPVAGVNQHAIAPSPAIPLEDQTDGNGFQQPKDPHNRSRAELEEPLVRDNRLSLHQRASRPDSDFERRSFRSVTINLLGECCCKVVCRPVWYLVDLENSKKRTTKRRRIFDESWRRGCRWNWWNEETGGTGSGEDVEMDDLNGRGSKDGSGERDTIG